MNGFDLSTISGIFVGDTPYSAIYKGSSLIWQSGPHDYSQDYLTIESLEDGNYVQYRRTGSSLECVIYYSTDKINWNSMTPTTGFVSFANLNKGAKVYIKGTNNTYGLNYGNSHMFKTTKHCNLYGNIMSLIYGDNFKNQTVLSSDYVFYNLFNSIKVVDASNLILPATTLTQYCYRNMFNNCTSLTTAPELPATTLAANCYYSMFQGCTSLTTAPELPVITLAEGCYCSMFQGCTSLTTAPELPATTLAQRCYQNMFDGCTSLTTAPELPATTLADYCYQSMFDGCTSLTTAPELPATTLMTYCYQNMFQGCTSLTTAPELPATTLAANCYQAMFANCSSLNYIKMLATDISASNAMSSWVYNVSSTGTFVKNIDATWDITGIHGVPSGWTVQTIDTSVSDNANVKIYVKDEGTGNYKFAYRVGNNVNNVGSFNTVGIDSGNNKYFRLKNNGVTTGYAYVANNIVITGFTKFKLVIKVYQSSGSEDIIGVNIINDDTNIGNVAINSFKSNAHLYAWQTSKGEYSTNGSTNGVPVIFDNLDPTQKYNIRITFRGTSKSSQYILFPSNYPTPTKTTGFTSSSDYTEIYG